MSSTSGALIQDIQSPPVTRIGVLELESFFPAKDRFALAMALNNLLAAPGFGVWLEGTPLDPQALLYTPQGKPRVAILSIAHLGDGERMFFVSLLLGQVLAWMRTQAGTTSLRALLVMDEVVGFMPPVANPPAKGPLLLLLKQARAFGLGVVLATQNPVDLDYKGLANAGTWFIGRLQTERDSPATRSPPGTTRWRKPSRRSPCDRRRAASPYRSWHSCGRPTGGRPTAR